MQVTGQVDAPEMEHSDETTLVQAAREDPAEFQTLYYRYRAGIYAYVRTRTEGDDTAADLTQQVFLQALEALPRYRGRHAVSFPVWLFRIARNALIDHHRRQRPTVTWDLVPAALHPTAEIDPEAWALRREEIARLREVFLTLNATERELLTLRYVAGLSIGEVAAVVGKSTVATQKKLKRLTQSLAARYRED